MVVFEVLSGFLGYSDSPLPMTGFARTCVTATLLCSLTSSPTPPLSRRSSSGKLSKIMAPFLGCVEGLLKVQSVETSRCGQLSRCLGPLRPLKMSVHDDRECREREPQCREPAISRTDRRQSLGPTWRFMVLELITLLIIPLKGLIGVIPLISRVISTVIIG